jgi:hypothetical protein
MKLRIILLSFISSLFLSENSLAGILPSSIPATSLTSPAQSQTETENRAYAGLVWTLQDQMSFIPDLTIGFRSLRVKSSDSVNGGEISTRIKLKDGISFDSTRLSYVGGERDVLGNIGVGYSAINSSFLGTLAVQGAYTRLGTDYQFNGNKFIPYLELLTTDKPNKVRDVGGTTTYSCPTNYQLAEPLGDVPTCNLLAPSDFRLKHQIKQIAILSNGLKIYSFKYKSRHGSFVGVMAQDLLANAKWSKAVVQGKDGYYMVNYSMLGIKMTTLENWNKGGKSSIMLN